MVPFSTEELSRLAHLARLELTDAEKAELADDLQKILEHFSALKEVDTNGVEPMSHPTGLEGRLREDTPQDRGLTSKQALANAPDHDGESFQVPRVIDPGAEA